jgi:lipopolysaccharide transport system ATP-binding protein
MDVVVQPEPDGRGGGWVPLDVDRQCRTISTLLFHLTAGGAVIIGERFHLLQKNRRYLCGCDLMSDIAIRVENLGKKYKIGANQARYQTLRESIVNGFSNSIERIKGAPPKEENIIWALKEINFEVKHGEVLGIIGRNGAGKSTLLKILSRITRPTTGRFELNGRVGSLLEVGTGFHPELTGRDNIYLSGAILGMKRKEINRKFDEIVDFAEIERFLDTPVKHYSSGMYMRLAFSVAAHLEPEILLVDEVLAVGDAEFQKKCLGKMGDVAGEGRTVLFVSHNMKSIIELCSVTIYLKKGFLFQSGTTQSIINLYLSENQKNQKKVFPKDVKERYFIGPGRIQCVWLEDENSSERYDFFLHDSISFCLEINEVKDNAIVGISIRDIHDQLLIHLSNIDEKFFIIPKQNNFILKVKLENILLRNGDYFVTFWLGDKTNTLCDRWGNVISFSVNDINQGLSVSQASFKFGAKWNIYYHIQRKYENINNPR